MNNYNFLATYVITNKFMSTLYWISYTFRKSVFFIILIVQHFFNYLKIVLKVQLKLLLILFQSSWLQITIYKN